LVDHASGPQFLSLKRRHDSRENHNRHRDRNGARQLAPEHGESLFSRQVQVSQFVTQEVFHRNPVTALVFSLRQSTYPTYVGAHDESECEILHISKGAQKKAAIVGRPSGIDRPRRAK
jgi:hypothetical protein